MWAWVDQLGLVLVDAGVAALVLLAATAGLMIAMRQPVRRVRLARATLVALIALAPLVWFELVPRINLVELTRESGLVSRPASQAGMNARWAPEALSAADQGDAPPLRPWFGRALTLTYLGGVAGGIVWLALGHLGLVWLARRSSEPSPVVRAIYRRLTIESGLHPPLLRVSARVRRPVLLGFPRPLILIPPELDPAAPGATDAARDQLRLGLLHELAHAEAGDLGFALAAHLAQAMWYALPPVWWVSAQLRLDQEFLADRRAAAQFGERDGYAAALLEFASSRARTPRPRPGPGGSLPATATTDGSALFQRLLMLLRCPFPVEDAPPAWWSWGLVGVVLIATLAASSLSVRTTAPSRPVAVAAASINSFRLAGLEVPARPPGPGGRAPLFNLPLRLPERFDLTLEVWADPAALRQTRVAGLPLGLGFDPPDQGPSTADAPAAWHHVHVRRDCHGVSLQVDGRPDLAPRTPRPLTAWLALEPAADREGRFRSLRLAW